MRAKGFKVIECLEKDLNSLYQIEVKYLDKFFKNLSVTSKGNSLNRGSQSIQSKYLEKLVNQTPIGVFKKSELGEPMRLYYYLSPLDLIQHHQSQSSKKEGFDLTYKMLSSLTIEQLVTHELGSYLTVSLLSVEKSNRVENYSLPDLSLLMLNETDDEALSPYLNNNNLNSEK